jgi:NAD(P)-dependent dehydrogenase (short-subunit alcohol dehydrogenase family)
MIHMPGQGDPIMSSQAEDSGSLTIHVEPVRYLGAGGNPALTGRVAVVTGGGSGIGAATAKVLALNGATVIVVGRRAGSLRATAEAIRASGGTAQPCSADVTDPSQVRGALERTVAQFGRLDIAFNNAGFQEPRLPLHEQPDEMYTRVFDANVRSLFLCLREQLTIMKQQPSGVIINNASVSALRNPNHGLSLYSASKAAVISLTRSVAMEYAQYGVRVNAVAPGRVVTDMMLRSRIADMRSVARSLPIGRMGHPMEIANLVTWLATDTASYITGQTFAADGGFLAA